MTTETPPTVGQIKTYFLNNDTIEGVPQSLVDAWSEKYKAIPWSSLPPEQRVIVRGSLPQKKIVPLYQESFAGHPWYENLSPEEIARRLEDNMKKRGFTALTFQDENAEEEDVVPGALWYDTPTLTELREERRDLLADWVAELQMRTGIDQLIWEREVMVDPAAQGKGIATTLRKAFLEHLESQYPEGAIVLTRMRDDNLGIIRIAEKLGYQRTGISHPSQKEGVNQEFWARVVSPRAQQAAWEIRFLHFVDSCSLIMI